LSEFLSEQIDPYLVSSLTNLAVGLLLGLWWSLGVLRFRALDDTQFKRALSVAVVVAALLGQFCLVMIWGLKHDAWSFFQARLLFAAFPSLALLLAWGLEAAATGRPALGRALSCGLACLYLVTTTYLFVEMSFELSGA